MVERIVADRDYHKVSLQTRDDSPNDQVQNFADEDSEPDTCFKRKSIKVGEPSRYPHIVQGRSVRILTYNFFMRPFVSTNGTDYKESRLKSFADLHLDRFDIICFQEVFDLLSSRKKRVVQEAKKAGLIYHAASTKPNYFSKYLCDGGLLVVSRYPITNAVFQAFKTPPVSDDAIAMKGTLYTEIDLSSIGGKKLHLFTAHMQASYLDLKDMSVYVESYVARYEQIREMQQQIEKKVLQSPTFNAYSDIVILAGDFNQNAAAYNQLQRKNIDLIKEEERYKPVLNLFVDEYRSLLCGLRSSPANPLGYTLIDCLRHAQGEGKFSPVTFADSYVDQEGKQCPSDPNLVGDSDLCTRQALDYIFWLVPNYRSDIADIFSRIPNNDQLLRYQPNARSYTPQELEGASSRRHLRVAVEKTFLDKMPVTDRDYAYCSDHYGISTRIEF